MPRYNIEGTLEICIRIYLGHDFMTLFFKIVFTIFFQMPMETFYRHKWTCHCCRCCYSLGPIHGVYWTQRWNSRPGIPATTIVHADGIVQKGRSRVQRWTVRTNRSVSITNYYNIIYNNTDLTNIRSRRIYINILLKNILWSTRNVFVKKCSFLKNIIVLEIIIIITLCVRMILKFDILLNNRSEIKNK